MIECTTGADVVGGLLDGVGKDGIAGQTKDEIDTVFFATPSLAGGRTRSASLPIQ